MTRSTGSWGWSAGTALLLVGGAAFSWFGARPSSDGRPQRLIWHVRAARALPDGALVGLNDVDLVLARVAQNAPTLAEREEAIGRFAVRPLVKGTVLAPEDFSATLSAPRDVRDALFPVQVSRGVAQGLRPGMEVIFVRDSFVVARHEPSGLAGLPIYTIYPSPTDSTTVTLVVRLPTALLESMRSLTTAGWHPVIVAPAPRK